MSADQKRIGRPRKITAALKADICDRIANGETVRRICRDEFMPGRSTVLRALQEDEAFRDQYARACELRADGWSEEIVEIADDGSNDFMEKLDRDGEPTGAYAFNKEAVMRSKLRVDTRLWLMAKAAPKKYGDKIAYTGPDGGPIQFTFSVDGASGDEAA